MNKENETGLCLALSEEYPTIIRVGGKEVRIYAMKTNRGQLRARFVADKSIRIIGPSRVKKGWIDAVTKKEEGHEEDQEEIGPDRLE